MEQLFEALEKRAINFPDRDALISNEESAQSIITNQQLVDNINCVASYFKAEGVQCLGLYMDNCAAWILCDLAAEKLGITLVPIPLFFTPSQVEHLVTSAGVSVIITQTLMSGTLKNNRSLNFGYIETSLPLENTIMLRVATKERADKKVDLANSIKITYTSGSTGEPKGVCLSAENIGAVCEGIVASMSSMAATNHLCVLPLATLLENIAGVYVCLMHGGVVITEPLAALGFMSNAEFDISKLLEKIELHQVGSLILLPQMLAILIHEFNETVAKQCSNLQFIAVGGGKSSTPILHQASKLGLPVFEGYGLSECGSVVSLNLPSQQRIGSVGKPLPHLRVVISEAGEIVIEGQSMLGYLGELDQPLNRIYTGDLGYIDADGYIFVSGRRNTKIVSSFGRNISPEWVEASFSASTVIAQIAVFGEARPSLSAVIVSAGNNIEEIQKAIDECNKYLPDYAQIRQWISAVQAFTPNNNLLTNNGRLKRQNIEKLYQEKLAELYA
jgi:long-subunit acyl-CoA synthetase (AMP-forming)